MNHVSFCNACYPDSLLKSFSELIFSSISIDRYTEHLWFVQILRLQFSGILNNVIFSFAKDFLQHNGIAIVTDSIQCAFSIRSCKNRPEKLFVVKPTPQKVSQNDKIASQKDTNKLLLVLQHFSWLSVPKILVR